MKETTFLVPETKADWATFSKKVRTEMEWRMAIQAGKLKDAFAYFRTQIGTRSKSRSPFYFPSNFESALTIALNLCHSEGNYGGKGYTKGGYEAYNYIPLGLSQYFSVMRQAIDLLPAGEKIRMVDAGAGMGDKLTLFYYMFGVDAELTGIEYNTELVNRGRNSMEHYHCRWKLIPGDITEVSYRQFNLVYAYNPMNDEAGMGAFFKRVLDTAKPGTVCAFVNVDTGSRAMEEFKNEFTQVHQSVYKVGK